MLRCDEGAGGALRLATLFAEDRGSSEAEEVAEQPTDWEDELAEHDAMLQRLKQVCPRHLLARPWAT